MTDVKISRAPDDLRCLARISVGGDPGVGYYCVYRGPRMTCIAALSAALSAMEAMDRDPKIDESITPIP